MNMQDIHHILQQHWGHTSFRPLQQDIIESVLQKNDTLALLPTGGGKSICFQVPALINEGICVVITPLIALMQDQVDQLTKRGISAIAIYAGLSKKQIDIALDNCIYGQVKFIYVSPERLKTDLFVERAKQMNIALLVVDEAHCISQWGYDFRPPYLEISKFREIIPGVPCIALTASANQEVKLDIIEKLGFKNPLYIENKLQRKYQILAHANLVQPLSYFWPVNQLNEYTRHQE
jgi:ATP-dependent DNA helicase RecQ